MTAPRDTPPTPEQMLFASTAQAFLEKEAPAEQGARTRSTGASFDAWWRQRAPSWAGRACWCPRSSVAATSPATAWPIWRCSPSRPARTVAPGPLHPGQRGAGRTGRSLRSATRRPSSRWCPARRWPAGRSTSPKPPCPLTAELAATATDGGYRLDGVKRPRRGRRCGRRTAGHGDACDGAVRQFLVRPTRPG